MRQLAPAVLLLAAVPALTQDAALAQETGPAPDAENFRDWVEFITPSEDERAFEEIGWRHTFWPAVEEARARRAHLDSLVNADSAIAALSIALGHDASALDNEPRFFQSRHHL